MKKVLVPSIMIVLSLAACSDNKATNTFNGTWEKADGEPSVCRDSFTFKGEDTFEIQNSRVQGGERSSGTYKHVENNDYKFDYGGVSDMFNIEIKDDVMNVQMSGSDNVCKYNKVE